MGTSSPGPTSILDAVGSLLHPSLQARAVSAFAGRFMRAGEVGDLETVRARFLAANRRTPRRIPYYFVMSPLTSRHVRVLEYVPRFTDPTRTLLHLPGGAYTKPADPRHFAFARELADRLGMRALVATYDLAPEHTWRGSRAERVELVSRAGAQSPDGLVLSGDSAGGGYALSVAQGVRDAGPHAVAPTRMVLVSPWLDLTHDVPGREEAASDDPWLTLPFLHVYAGWWAGSEADRSLPEVSPALGDLHGLPPTLAFCGTRDLLLPENRALAAKAAGSGWDHTLVEADEMIHVYPILPIPEAHRARDQIVEFLA